MFSKNSNPLDSLVNRFSAKQESSEGKKDKETKADMNAEQRKSRKLAMSRIMIGESRGPGPRGMY